MAAIFWRVWGFRSLGSSVEFGAFGFSVGFKLYRFSGSPWVL